MKTTVPGWGGFDYGFIVIPEYTECGEDITEIKFNTLPTMVAEAPNFNWVPRPPQAKA